MHDIWPWPAHVHGPAWFRSGSEGKTPLSFHINSVSGPVKTLQWERFRFFYRPKQFKQAHGRPWWPGVAAAGAAPDRHAHADHPPEAPPPDAHSEFGVVGPALPAAVGFEFAVGP